MSVYAAIEIALTSPCKLVGRFEEAKRLRDFVLQALQAQSAKKGSVIYITGHSGVGKSLCVDHVLKELSINHIFINLCTFNGDLKKHM
jgi:predicted ATPase